MLSAGSLGVVNPGDAGKIIFFGSIVQLGVGVGGLELAAVDETVASRVWSQASAVVFPQTSATLRYDVPPEGVQGWAVGNLQLQLRYRNGSGRVVATLIEVEVASPGPGQPDAVVERPLIAFDSASPDYGLSNQFQTHRTERQVEGDPTADHILSFGPNVYYIVVVLSGPEAAVGHPPAVSSIEILSAS
jgi:hypothetical protein